MKPKQKAEPDVIGLPTLSDLLDEERADEEASYEPGLRESDEWGGMSNMDFGDRD
jgi:hypothetical protein